jgi:hypothetical protein
MKRASCLLLVFLVYFQGNSQQSIPSFGKVSMAELQMQRCSFEPEAPAMKIFDVQESTFELMTYGARLKIERRVRIKIFNDKGYEHASIRIPYVHKKWAALIKDLKGIVYNLEPSGKITTHKLDEKDFFKEKAIDHLGIVNFTFPHLRPGSVIEFSYTKIERNILQMDPWLIQDEIPVAYSTHIITTPVETQVREKVYGMDSIAQVVDLLGSYNSRRRTTYYKENIPSFKSEPFMSSRNDNLIRVIYLVFPRGAAFYTGLTSSDFIWKMVGAQTLRSSFFGQQIEKPLAGTEKILDSAKKITDLKERVGYIFNVVQQRMKHNSLQSFNADDLGEAWNSQAGTSAAINLLLLNMLVNADVDAHPLLVSTRDNGKVKKDFPSFGQLNGVDVIIFHSNGYYVLDASLPYQSFQTPPFNILNREALVLIPDNIHWLTIKDDRPLLKQSVTVFADMSENGNLEGTANSLHFDYSKSIRLDSNHRENRSGEKFFEKGVPGLQVVSKRQDNATNLYEPLFESTEFIFQLPQTDKFYFLSPLFLATRPVNPFIQEKRNTDIDLGSNQEYIISLEITLPPSFEVDHLMQPVDLRMPDSSLYYKRIMTKTGDRINFTQVFEIRRPLFEKEEYLGIQQFYKKMHALMAEDIVIKKK